MDIKLENLQHEQELNNLRLKYNRLCFVLQLIPSLVDDLEGTTFYRQDIKYLANNLRKKVIPICNEHQNAYVNFGNVNNEGKELHSEDIFNITDLAYEKYSRFATERQPHHIVSLMTIIDNMEKENPNVLNEVETPFTPLAR